MERIFRSQVSISYRFGLWGTVGRTSLEFSKPKRRVCLRSVLVYILFDKGHVSEVLHWDGSQKLNVLTNVTNVFASASLQFPHGFCFYSKLRRLSRRELTGDNVVQFFDAFLKSQQVLLVFESGDYGEGTFTFTPHRLKVRDVERADFVGLLDEEEVYSTQQVTPRSITRQLLPNGWLRLYATPPPRRSNCKVTANG